MKRILSVLLISLFACFGVNAQSPTFANRTNGTYTPVDPYLSVPKALYIPKTCDTTNALHGGKDTIGAIIFDTCNHKMWIRDGIGTVHRWTVFNSAVTEIHPVDWYNVKNAGADNIGIIDASNYVQSPINTGYKIMYLPAGRYLFRSTVECKDSIVIIGDGSANTIIVLDTNIPAFHVGRNGQHVQFLNIGFQGTKSGGASTAQEGIFSDSATIYVHNVRGYNLGGFAIRFKHDLYNRPYPGTGLVGSIVSDCNFESSYGGIKLDSSAEYIGVSNSVFVANTYGVHIIGGNARFSNCNVSSNTYGVYMTYGPNGHHGNWVGGNINHNLYNIYMDSVVAGFTFVGADIYAGTNQLYIEDCKNVEFLGGDLVGLGTATFLNNDSTIHFFDVNMRTKPTWAITGNKPLIISLREAANSISMFDPVNNKRFDLSYSNDTAQVAGNLYLLKAPVARMRLGYQTTSTAKLVVNSLDDSSVARGIHTNISSGPTLSNGISNTFHDRDTVTSANINDVLKLPSKVAQFQKRFICGEDGLAFTGKQSVLAAILFNAANNANLNTGGGNLPPVAVDAGLSLNQNAGTTGTTTYSGSSTPVNSPASVLARYTSTNLGGSALTHATGYISGFLSTIELGTRDTLDNYSAINTGAKAGSGIVKTYYHHYIHTNPGTVANWGIYQEGSTVGNYFQGTMGIGTNAQTSQLDILATNGYSQFRMRTSYTPTSTADTNGNTGDVSWDDSFIYIKTSAGWKRSALSTF